MKITAALGRNNRPLPLSKVNLITPTCQRSVTSRLACSVGVAHLNAIVANNYMHLRDGVMLDKEYESRLSDVINAFDRVASRIPSTIARSINANRTFYSRLRTKSGLYGVPSDVISRLLLTHGSPFDQFTYHMIGALVSNHVHFLISNLATDSYAKSFSALVGDLDNRVMDYLKLASYDGGAADTKRDRYAVIASSHISTVRGIIMSVLEDYIAGVAGTEDKVISSTQSQGLSGDDPALIADAIKVMKVQLFAYFAICASHMDKYAHRVQESMALTFLQGMPQEATAFYSGNDDEKVDLFNLGLFYTEEEAEDITPISNHSIGGKPLYEYTLPADQYKSAGYTSFMAIVMKESQLNEKEVNKMFDSMGISQKDMASVIQQLFDVSSRLVRGSTISEVLATGIHDHVNRLQASLNSYLNLMTTLLGATQDAARLAVKEFLGSPDWKDSLAGLIYNHAVLGVGAKPLDLADKFNALTLSKDGVVGNIKAGHFDITVVRDPISLSASNGASNSRINVTSFGNPFEDAYFRYGSGGNLDGLDLDGKAGNSETKESILLGETQRSTNALFGLIDLIGASVNATTAFLAKGDLKAYDNQTVEFANTLLPTNIINFLSDGSKLRNVSKQSGLTLASDYSISRDAKDAVIDQLGIIDAAIVAAFNIVGNTVLCAAGARVAPAVDILKGIDDIRKQRAEILNTSNLYLPANDESDLAFTDCFSTVSKVVEDVFGLVVDNDLPSAEGAVQASITVPIGVDVSAKDMIRIFGDILGTFDAHKRLKDGKRKLLSYADRFNIQKRGKDANLKLGASGFSALWNEFKSNDFSSFGQETTATSFSNILSSSILLSKFKNGSASSFVTRSPEEARITGILPLSHLKEKSPKELVNLGVSTDLRIASNMFKFLDASIVSASSDIPKSVGKLLALATSGRDVQRFTVTGGSITDLATMDSVINGTSAFAVVEAFDTIVRPASISIANFKFLDYKTFFGSTSEDLLYNVLDHLGINPTAQLSFAEAQVLLTYNIARQHDYQYPITNKMMASELVFGEVYTYLDLLTIEPTMVKKNDNKLVAHNSCSLFVWSDDLEKQEPTIDLFDIGTKKSVVVADADVIDMSLMDGSVQLAIESSVDLPFGQRLPNGLAENMLLALTDKVEHIF